MARHQFELFDDFLWHISPHLWTNLASEGTVAIDADGVGGVVDLTASNTDNNEVALVTTNELFLLASDKPVMAECRLKLVEANTDDANVAFGFADAIGANLLLDDGAGPSITTTGALIYKVDGETVWRCYSKNGATTTTTLTTTTAGGSAYQTLAIEIRPVDGTNCEITFYCDGQPLRDSNNRPIKHVVPYASAGEMDFGVYCKTGSANAQAVNVDYIWAAARR